MSTKKLEKSENIIGLNISLLRKSLKLKQYQLAEKLGTSAGHLSEIESGKKMPGSEFLFSLKRIFDIDVGSLFEDQNQENGKSKPESSIKKTEETEKMKELYERLLGEKDKRIEMLEEQVEFLKRERSNLEKDKTSA